MSAAAVPRRIRVAVVGTGEFGRNHARVYRELDGAELVGVYDQNRQRAAAVAAEFQAPVLQSLEELRGRADAVSVAGSTLPPARVGWRLLGMGPCVFVEEAMARGFCRTEALFAGAFGKWA